MENTERLTAAAAAHAKCAEMRAAMNAEKVGSRKWLAAEAGLNFWQGKAAMLETESGWASC